MNATVNRRISGTNVANSGSLGLQLSGASLEIKAAPQGKPPKAVLATDSQILRPQNSGRTAPNRILGEPVRLGTKPSLHQSSGTNKMLHTNTMSSIVAKQNSRGAVSNVNESGEGVPAHRQHASGVRVMSKHGARGAVQVDGSGSNYNSAYALQNQIESNRRPPHTAVSGTRIRKSRSNFGQENNARSNSIKHPQTQFPLKVQNLNSMVQIRKKRPKLKYSEKIAFQAHKERQIYSQQVQSRTAAGRKYNKILDVVLLTHSCRVKHPSQAIKSKLAGENIVDVKEEDLVHFTNLINLDISDNQIRIAQLSNLVSLEELDIQYNNLDHLQLASGAFPRLSILRLSYNKIPPSHLVELGNLHNLQQLDLAANDFCTLPSSLDFLSSLTELNLSSNNFSSDSVLVNPGQLFVSLASIPQLQKLNLSRNKLKGFHSENLQSDNAFSQLEELDFSFNSVDNQQNLLYCRQLFKLKTLIITGNPIAITGVEEEFSYLEDLMASKGGELINESLNQSSYLRRGRKSGYVNEQQVEPLMIANGPEQQQLFPPQEQQQQVEEEHNQFFLTEQMVPQDDPVQHQQYQQKTDQAPAEQMSEIGENVDEDFGKMKMEIFKQQCRNILGTVEEEPMPKPTPPPAQPDPVFYADPDLEETSTDQDNLDIVTAYKSLKLAMSKNLKGLAEGREQCSGKGYLKPTMASRQAQRETLGMNLNTGQSESSRFPAIRGQTAPAPALGAIRGASRGKTGRVAKGIDGRPIQSQQRPRVGMTLQDYAVGGAWGTGDAWSSINGKENQSSAGNPRTATAPCWRKPKAQRIDEKVQKLLDSYKDTSDGNVYAQTESQRREQQTKKYFPGKDVPLGQLASRDQTEDERYSYQLAIQN